MLLLRTESLHVHPRQAFSLSGFSSSFHARCEQALSLPRSRLLVRVLPHLLPRSYSCFGSLRFNLEIILCLSLGMLLWKRSCTV